MRWAVVIAFACAGCGPRFPTPYPADALAAETRRPGKALVHYLSQPDADVAVCAAGREGPPAVVADRDAIDRLRLALRDGVVAPATWGGCVTGLWPALDAGAQDALASELVDDLHRITVRGALDDEGVSIDVVVAMRDALLERPEGQVLPGDQVRRVSADVRARIRAGRLGPRSTSLATRLLNAIELDAGLWHGVLVNGASLAELTDEESLLAIARRIPDPELRAMASERLIRVRLERLDEPALTARADEIVAAVRSEGRWALPVAEFPVLSARWRAGEDLPAVLRVLQDPRTSTAALRAAHADRRVPPDSALRLREGLDITVGGLAHPVHLCPGVDAWDPTPCVSPSRLAFSHPGVIHDPATVVIDA